MKLAFAFFCLILFSACDVTQIIKYPKQDDEIITNKNLNRLFKNTKSPAIVLRVPNNSDKVTSQSNTSKDETILYNSIEKEFLKAGFIVRDRGLFNELVSKSTSNDYSNIKELTETDLILEVVNIEHSILYTTNKVILKNKAGRMKETILPTSYQGYGASIEFKVVIVKNNEIAGNYKFNYNPCPEDGCLISTYKRKGKTKEYELIETITTNKLETFIRKCSQDLVRSFRDQ